MRELRSANNAPDFCKSGAFVPLRFLQVAALLTPVFGCPCALAEKAILIFRRFRIVSLKKL